MSNYEKTKDELVNELETLRQKVTKLENQARLKAVSSIESSELKLLEIVENTSEAIFVIQDGAIKFANLACSEYSGYSIEEISRLTNILDFIHPDDKDVVAASFRQRPGNSRSLNQFEFRLLCKDQTTKWAQIHSSLITWQERTAYLCFITDVSERRRMETELEEKADALEKRVKEITCLYKISKLRDTADLQLSQIFQGIVDLIPPAWQFPEIACARIVLDDDEFKTDNFGQCMSLQSEKIIADGVSTGFVEVGYLEPKPDCDEGPFLKEERQLVGAISKYVSDILLKKRSEETLRIRGMAMDTSINGIRMVDSDGKVFYANKASLRMWGHKTQNDVIGLHVSEFWKDHDQLEEALKQLARKGHFSGTLTALRTDGTTFEALVSLNRVVDEYGKLVGLVASFTDVTDQKLAEEVIRERELRFGAITNSVFDAIILMDDCGNVTFWNAAAERMFGYESSEALGQNVHNLLAPSEYHSAHRAAFTDFVKTGQGSAVGKITELIACRKGGQKFPIELSLSSFQMKGRWNAAGIIRDISDRIKAVEDLKQSEERFRQVADSADEWFWEVDQNGMYTYSSSAVEKILGYSIDEVVGKKFFYDLFLSEEREELKRLAFSVFAETKSFTGFITRNLRKNKEIAVVESSGVAILDQHGQMKGYRGVDKDITERFRAEEDHRRLFTAIECTAGSVVVTDAQGAIEYVNPAFEKTTGYSSEEVIGKNPRLMKSGKHDRAFYRNLWDTISGGEIWSGVFINKKKDGTLVHEEGTISPVKDSDGRIINYVRVSRDVTREIDLQKQLLQSQKMEAIGALAGGIAHDFNNILFAITGNTELAMQGLPENSGTKANLERVLNAANRAGDMVKQILAFSRQDKPERQPVDLTPIIKEGIKFLRASIPAPIEINQHIQSNLPKIDGDPTQIHQVLINLCVNASHSMRGTSGVLTINLQPVRIDLKASVDRVSIPPGTYLNLTVSDTGHGMSPEILDRIFEPYFTTKEKGKGTGFGLSIVHSIVQNHGGFITVKSDPGKGSTFDIYLPVVEETVESQDKSEKLGPVRGGNEQILVVDDEPMLVDVGKSIFESLGYRVVAVTDSLDALEIFGKNPDEFDLVFTDLAMPKMSGDELAEKIRSVRGDIPIIICTGLSESLSQERRKELNIGAVIEKPLLRREMARIVRTALDTKN